MNESALPALDAALSSPVVRIERDAGTPSVALDPDLPFEDLRDALRALFADDTGPAAELAGQAVKLDFGRRDLHLFDLRRLVHMLRDEFFVTVAGIRCTPEALHRYAEQALKLRITLAEPEDEPSDDAAEPSLEAPVDLTDATDAPEPAGLRVAGEDGAEDADAEPADVEPADVEPSDVGGDPSAEPADDEASAEGADPSLDASADAEDDADPAAEPVDIAASIAASSRGEGEGAPVHVVQRTLRSGARVRHPGDVIVFGDVNAGAHIEADGNIVVLGALRGLAHAGARGDDGAVIISFDLRPTQIRIGSRIAFPPEKQAESGPRLLTLLQRDRAPSKGFVPELARVEGSAIVLEEFRGRLPGGGR